jgi:hypothetical protein
LLVDTDVFCRFCQRPLSVGLFIYFSPVPDLIQLHRISHYETLQVSAAFAVVEQALEGF